ncbi:hypothetical protein BS78_01G303100 [Paspalum vaginatum]|nr:hypothetical protein BS78_01G303100 [Paspalum vaginatum]
MAHDPTLAYADYFAAAAGGGVTTTLVPEVEDDERHHQLQYGHVQQAQHHGPLGVFGAVGGTDYLAAAEAHGKAALADFAVLAEQQHRHAPPLTSLSLHGPAAEAAALALHQQHQAAAWQQQHTGQAQQGAWHLMRGSRFLRPAQQLLQEFCSLPVDAEAAAAASSRPPAKPESEDDSVGGGGRGSSSSAPLSAQIQAMDAAELQRLKAKLYALLQEVERRYRRYREQMRAVAGSFEAVAGERAAAAYTRLASRTISKHFRSLRDGVAAQVQAVRRALGEKDADGAPATAVVAKGETTPRLRVLDQCLRQHRAYQAGVLESQPWRPQRGLPERAVSVLRAWLFEHFLHPYPSDVDKHILARQTGLSRSQVSNWFINARVRLWKPMVEEMYAEEMKDDPQDQGGAAARSSNANKSGNSGNPSGSFCASELGQQRVNHHGGAGGVDCGGVERKPTRAQLVVHDPGSLASVVSIGSGRGPQQQQQQTSINFGMMDHLDFGAYNDDPGPAAFGGGVSLTLGLQQHADGGDPHGGVNVAFAAAPSSSAAAHEFLFTAGGEQQVVAGGSVHTPHGQFGGADLEGDGMAAASHYHRGLSAATGGFQFLHDMAGWSH